MTSVQYDELSWYEKFIIHKHIKILNEMKHFCYLIKLETKRGKSPGSRRKRGLQGRGQIQAIAEGNQGRGKDPITRRSWSELNVQGHRGLLHLQYLTKGKRGSHQPCWMVERESFQKVGNQGLNCAQDWDVQTHSTLWFVDPEQKLDMMTGLGLGNA